MNKIDQQLYPELKAKNYIMEMIDDAEYEEWERVLFYKNFKHEFIKDLHIYLDCLGLRICAASLDRKGEAFDNVTLYRKSFSIEELEEAERLVMLCGGVPE